MSRFRQGSALAVAAAGLALLLVGGADAEAQAAAAQDPATVEAPAGQSPAATDGAVLDTLPQDTAAVDPARSVSEATGTIRQLLRDSYGFLPKILIALGLLLVAGLLAKLVRTGLRRLLGSWERAEATAALVAILIWLLALGAGLSVLVGDPRALIGSVGLFGLALSWALQVPIESFAGWLMNSFRGYYRAGDRIAVGEVFGDVARIDFLTTTVFEAGGPEKPVQGAQATGALVTFPNLEVLRSNIVNYTRDFPYVWDELTIAIAPESDLRYSMELIRATTDAAVGDAMQASAEGYARLLERAHLAYDVATRPEVFAAPSDSWTDVTVRYLVPARARRKWSSEIFQAITEAMARPENRERVVGGLPRQVVESR